jgi:hypothetical protein
VSTGLNSLDVAQVLRAGAATDGNPIRNNANSDEKSLTEMGNDNGKK